MNTGPAKTSAQSRRRATQRTTLFTAGRFRHCHLRRPTYAQLIRRVLRQAEKTDRRCSSLSIPPLTPAPAAGDVVNLTITAMSTNAAALGVRDHRILPHRPGAAVAALKQDVRDDQPRGVHRELQAEVLTASATISSISSASAHVRADDHRYGWYRRQCGPPSRMPGSLQPVLAASHDLMAGCVVTLPGTPLSRFNASAQLMAWTGSDIVVDICPAPKVVSATRLSAVVRVA